MIFYKLIFLILILIILVRLKLHLAISLLIVSGLTVLLYNIEPKYIFVASREVFLNVNNLSVMFVIIFISFLSTALSARGNLLRTFESLHEIFGDIRISLAVIPSLLGMVPLPAGALFSAPMVNEGGDFIKLKPCQKHMINYVFRHVWELCLPLYPAVLLISTTFRIPLQTVIKTQIIYAVLYAVIGGLFIFMPIKVKKMETNSGSKIKSVGKLLVNFWPIFVIVLSIMVVRININFIILGTIIAYYFLNKMNPGEAWGYLKKSFSFSIIAIVWSVLFFKNLIQNSSVLNGLPGVMNEMGINPVFILFLTTFIIGFLTGLTLAPIGIGFSILLPLFYKSPEVVDYSRVMLAFIGGFMGVNFSPTHLCLSMTKEYFNVTYGEIYRCLIPIMLVFMCAVVALFLMSYPPAY